VGGLLDSAPSDFQGAQLDNASLEADESIDDLQQETEEFPPEDLSEDSPGGLASLNDELSDSAVLAETSEAPSEGNSQGTLTMVLSGSMALKLRYEFPVAAGEGARGTRESARGREVTVAFSGEALSVRLEDGTEFRVPVAPSGARKELKGTATVRSAQKNFRQEFSKAPRKKSQRAA
jgi:hypothetical protein